MNANGAPTPIGGKVIAGILGLLLGGPVGLVIGLILGHLIDRRSARFLPDGKENQATALGALFSVLGYVAKLDGQVSQQELSYARALINRLKLNEEQKVKAMKSFNEGKNPGFELGATLSDLKQAARRTPKFLYFFINAQVQMAYADGVVKHELKPVLQLMARQLGLRQLNFTYYDTIFGWGQRYQQYQQQGGHQGAGAHSAYVGPISAAYKTLGVNESATEQEIKKAYRKLMSKFHPDKLMSKGLSDKEMEEATEKVQRIKAAYEQVKRSKNF